MNTSVKDVIRNRTSIRTFQPDPISSADRTKLNEIVGKSTNPFGVPVDIRILDAGENNLSSPVIVGANTYIAAKAQKIPKYELAIGYQLQDVLLDAEELGLGNVWLAATLSRAAFEKAMQVRDNEVMPAASPLGYPAAKRSIRESMMRKALKADTRLPYGDLFFKETFSQPLNPKEAGRFGEALEMMRLAPSATNKQPWRAVVDGDTVHFYEKKSKGMENKLGDIQKVDVGIGLAHFDRTLKEAGVDGQFIDSDPGLPHGDSIEYLVSYKAD